MNVLFEEQIEKRIEQEQDMKQYLIYTDNPAVQNFLDTVAKIIAQEFIKIAKGNSFPSPFREWINHRLERLHETLNKNTTMAASALKELLGNIELESVTDEICYKPYYRAHTKVQTLALLDKRHTGSNWLHLRRVRDLNPHVQKGRRISSPLTYR